MIRALPLITLCIISIIFSCSSDDENANKICRPVGLYSETDGDSLTFGYDASGLVRTIDWYTNQLHTEFTYNSSNELIGAITKFAGGSGGAYRSYDITWVGGTPISLKEYGGDHEGEPLETTFAHDANERLVKRETILPSTTAVTRYEYDDSDNVIKIFYSGIDPVVETLGQELTSFDSRPRFFDQDEQLRVYYIYVYGEQPSINNVLKSKVYMSNVYNGPQGSPITRTYTVTYNSDGKVNASSLTSQVSQSTWELNFHGVEYDCR